MSLTPEQIQQMNQITGLNKPVSSSQASNQTRVAQLQAIAKSAPQKPDPLASVHIGGSANSAKAIGDSFNAGASKVYEGVQQATHPGQAAGNLPIGLLKAGAGGVEAAFSPIAPVMKPVGDVVNKVADKISDVPAVQNFAQSKVGEFTAKAAEGIGNASEIAGAIAGSKGTPEVKTAIQDTASNIKDSLTPKPPTPEEVVASRAQEVASQKAATAVKVQRVSDEWKAPTVPGKASNPAQFNAATKILSRSPDTPMFLAEQKLSPAQHIENGRYATADSATALRDTAGQMSADALRPSLQEADYTIPKTSPSDVLKPSVKNISRDPNIEATDAEAVQKNIQKRIGALQRKYPEGMSLTNMLDESITYAKNGGYKPTSIADNNAATANRIIGSTLGDMLQESAPKDLPVAEFRKYQSQYYKAADYLDALNTKKAPMSVGQYIAHKGAQVAGATIGHGIGGGILGGVGGYMIGGALEHAIENMALPMRDAFLKNLKITKPDVYSKVVDFLGNEEAARATRLALPEGKALGTPENPRPMGQGLDTSGVQMVPAQKLLPTADPKTGRMQKTYSSQAQGATPLDLSQENAVKPPMTSSNSTMSVHDIARTIQSQMPELQYSRIYDIAERAAELTPEKQADFMKGELSKIRPDSVPTK